MKYNRGFTIIEMIVVIAIIGIIASVVFFNVVSGTKKSRDVDRQADLRTLQSAIELYKQRYGRYPAQCTRAVPGLAGVWSGQPGTDFACVTGEQYIMGHVDTTDSDRDGNTTERFTFAPSLFRPFLLIKKFLIVIRVMFTL
jgi:prepilin-type N-terminal cleavage/methylation domain-containing protein